MLFMKCGLLLLLLLTASLAFGAENCSMFDGKCKDFCAENELPEQGAFLDCTEKQECCVPNKKETKKNAESSITIPTEKDTILKRK